MPTYEYSCERCGIVEICHSIAEPARSSCPVCGRNLCRLISGGGGLVVEPGGYWEIGRDGREKKVTRAERERQWHSAAGRTKPIT